MIRAPENLIVQVSGKSVVMRSVAPWFSLVADDKGLIWHRNLETHEWWGKPADAR